MPVRKSESSTTHRVALNSGVIILAKAIGLLTVLPLNAILANHLGAESYGYFAYAATTATVLQAMASGGLSLFLARELGRQKENAGELLCLALVGCLVVTAAFGVAAIIITEHTSNTAQVLALQGYAVGAFFMGSTDVVLAAAAGYERFTLRAIGSVTMYVVKFAFAMVALLAHANLLSVIVAVSLAHAATFALSLALVWRRVTPLRLPRSLEPLRFLVSRSLPLALMPVLGMVYFRSDVWLLGILSGPRTVAVYQAGYVYFDTVIVLPGLLGNTLFPTLARLHRTNRDDFVRLLRVSARFVTLSAFLSSIVLLLSAFAVRAWYAVAFRNTSSLVIILLLAGVFPGFANALAQYVLMSLGRADIPLKAMAAGGIFSIVANSAWAIPSLGASGAAIVTTLTELLVCGILIGATCSLVPDLHLWREIKPVLAIAALSGGTLALGLAAGAGPVPCSITAASIFCAATLRMRVFPEVDEILIGFTGRVRQSVQTIP